MVLLTEKIILLLILWVIYIFDDVSAQSSTMPMLKTNDTEKIINEGETVELECSGYKNIIFYYPNANSKKTIRQESHLAETKNGTEHRIKFFRTLATPQDTGYYGCAYDNSQIEKNKFRSLNKSSIYVYVKSNKTLMIRPKNKVINGYVNHQIVIPCRPTSPEYDGFLSILDLDDWEHKTILHKEKAFFEPKIGFTLKNLDEEDNGVYECKFVDNTTAFSQTCHISLHIYSPPELIIKTTSGSVIQGQDFQLKCTMYRASSDYAFKLQWLKPDGTPCPDSSEEGRIITSKSRNKKFLQETISLILKNIEVSDQGVYTCRVLSDNLQIEPQNYSISINDPPKLEITPVPDFAIRDQDFQLDCTIRQPPVCSNFTLLWVKPDGTINADLSPEDGRISSTFTNEPLHKTISLKIANIGFKDQGRYTCEFLSDGVPVAPQYIHVNVYDPPKLEMGSTKFAITGQDFHFECQLCALSSLNLQPRWITPNQDIIDQDSKNARITLNMTVTQTKWPEVNKTSFLTIKNITSSDAGNYTCAFMSKSKLNVSFVKHQYIKVYDSKDVEISLSYEYPNSNVTKTCVGWEVNFSAIIHASPATSKHLKIEWHRLYPDFGLISIDDEYDVYSTENQTKLIIRKAKRFSVYYVRVFNGFKNATLSFELDVYMYPVVRFSKKFESRYYPNTNFKFDCHSEKVPNTNISWYYLERDTNAKPQLLENATMENNPKNTTSNETTSTLYMILNKSAKIICKACNILLCNSINQTIIIADDKLELGKSQNEMLEGNNINITCKGSKLYYSNIRWYDKNRKNIKENSRIKFSLQNSSDTLESIMIIASIKKSDERSYLCGATMKNGSIVFREVKLSVEGKIPAKSMPAVIESNMNGSEIVYDLKTAGEMTINLTCYVKGLPKPSISWFKDDLRIDKNDGKFSDEEQLLRIIHPDKRSSGMYRCVAENLLNSAQASVKITLKERPQEWPLIVGIVLGVGACIVFGAVGARIYWIKKIKAEKVPITLENLPTGNYDDLNLTSISKDHSPKTLNLSKWAFSRDKLRLQKRLGYGQFGMVVQAKARGIVDSNTETVVAVKMVRKMKESMLAELSLISEFRVLSYLGKHLNIVNLLGAVTDRVKGLLVIVEFCEYGNLEEYLFKCRENFVSQTKIDSEAVNRAIRQTLENKSSIRHTARWNYAYSFFSRYVNSTHRNATGAIESDLAAHYPPNLHRDYSAIILTEDLLIWAYQVALGMEYVSQKKVLHGDLAARNILLANNNIIKICDFGLAKKLYHSGSYLKKGNAPLPFKWMAIESIRDKVFTTQSDVWSFGVLLWEMFTLAATPYPGLDPEDIYRRLDSGFRMEKTEYMTDEIYYTMRKCWEKKPLSRPTFSELVEIIGNMLPDHVAKYFIELNDSYIQSESESVQPENCSAAPASDGTMVSIANGAAIKSSLNANRSSSEELNVVVVHSTDQTISTTSAETKPSKNPHQSSTGTLNRLEQQIHPSHSSQGIAALVENSKYKSADSPIK